jgi:hypothetical protein
MGQLIYSDGYGMLNFSCDQQEAIQISFNCDEDGVTSIKLVNDQNEAVASHFVLTKIEYWTLKPK